MVEGRAVLFSLQGSRSDVNTEHCGDRTSNFTKTSPLHYPSYHFAYHSDDPWPTSVITRSGLVIHVVVQVLRDLYPFKYTQDSPDWPRFPHCSFLIVILPRFFNHLYKSLSLTYWLFDRMTDCWINRIADLLTNRLTDYLIEQPTNWLTGWSLLDWLTFKLSVRMSNWRIISLVHSLTYW